jgi:AcrR family transcriptional regulator
MRDAVQSISTRDALLDATDRLLARYGYRKMTIDDLAREVGIGKGSVYLHFSSKEEIVLSHIDRIIDRLKSRLRAIAETRSGPDVRLCDMLVERVVYRFDSVQHYSQSLNDLLSFVRPKLLERRKRYFNEEAAILAAVITEGQQAGIFAKGNAVDLAQILLNATNALLPYSLSTAELGDRKDIADRSRRIATVLIKGLKFKD